MYDQLDLRKSFIQAKRSITNFLKEIIKEKRGLKYTIIIKILMKRQETDNKWRYTSIYLRSNAITVTRQRFYLNDAFNDIYDLLDKWQGEASGWVINRIDDIHININKYEPLSGSSYLPLPKELNRSSKELMNIKNKDIYCFKWCHIRMLNPQNKNAERINKADKEITKTLDYTNIIFPIKEKQYLFIEKRFNMNINIFKHDKGVIPFYISRLNNNQILNLLLIENEDNTHYVFIKDFNSLIYSKTKHKARKYFCMNCLQNFSTQEVLNKHKETCLFLNDNITPLFEKGIIKFNNYDKQLPIPFKVYADVECYNKKLNIEKGKSTKLYSKHIPNSIGAKLVCIDEKYTNRLKYLKAKDALMSF